MDWCLFHHILSVNSESSRATFPCDINFALEQLVSGWNLGFCWWSDTVVEFFIEAGSVTFVIRLCQYHHDWLTVTTPQYFIVGDSWICTLNCYSVSVRTFLTLLVFKGSDSFYCSFVWPVNWVNEVTARRWMQSRYWLSLSFNSNVNSPALRSRPSIS